MSVRLRPKIPADVFREAVREFWRTRAAQAAAQRARGDTDRGQRSAVTGGRQMDGFLRSIVGLLVGAGISHSDIYTKASQAQLPGFFRPHKGWDLVVVRDGQLVAALELKSQVGSLGNNFNNRTEEALGAAVDLWTAYREGAFPGRRPWLGYLLLLEDCPAARRPVAVQEPHFPVREEFRGTSYATRYEIFCRKLVRERQYDAACLLLSSQGSAFRRKNYAEPAEDLSARSFLEDLLRHVV